MVILSVLRLMLVIWVYLYENIFKTVTTIKPPNSSTTIEALSCSEKKNTTLPANIFFNVYRPHTYLMRSGIPCPIVISFWLWAPSAGLEKVAKVVLLQSCSGCVRTSDGRSVQESEGLGRRYGRHRLCTGRQSHAVRLSISLNRLICSRLLKVTEGKKISQRKIYCS